MKTRPLTDKHRNILADYGLWDIPADACMCLSFQPGEAILQEGLPITWLAIVVSGKAKVCSTAPNGKHLILCYYLSKGMVGDMELMAGLDTATATMIAITEFTCIAIPFRGYAAKLKSNTEFLNKLGKELAEKLVRCSDNFVLAALHSGEERLCAYILQTSHDGIFSDIITDASGSVGMSYRHVLRLLKALCAEGVLEKRESGYRILDREGLARRANFD